MRLAGVSEFEYAAESGVEDASAVLLTVIIVIQFVDCFYSFSSFVVSHLYAKRINWYGSH